MRIARVPHRWDVSPRRAVEIQRALAARVLHSELPREPELIAGADMAFDPDGEHCIAGVVVWNARTQIVVERQSARARMRFPYVPGLLSFREAPAVLAACRRLRTEPDLLMLDGQGLAHPRRFGLACHIGLLLDRPTLGCAKSLLCGEHRGVRELRGATADLLLDGDLVGRVVRTRRNVRCVYVSVGHRITLDAAVRCVIRCATRYRLPEPTRLAHQYVTTLRHDRPE